MSILNIKPYKLNVEETQKKFDANWKKITEKDESVDLVKFESWRDMILAPIKRITYLTDKINKYPVAQNSRLRRLIEEIKLTNEYKLAFAFSQCDWEPVCDDLSIVVDELSSRITRLENLVMQQN